MGAGRGAGWGAIGLDRLAHRRIRSRWRRLAGHVAEMRPAELMALRHEAAELRAHVDAVDALARDRLAHVPAPDPVAPPGADWVWRPGPWQTRLRPAILTAPASGSRLGADLAVFHDGPPDQISVSQGAAHGGPHPVTLAIRDFDGTFVSLVADLPPAGLAGLGRPHILGIEAVVSGDRPLEGVVRLNLRHGPDTEQITRGLAPGPGPIEFDLAYSGIGDREITAAWIDLIFERPERTTLGIADLVLSRRRRAEF